MSSGRRPTSTELDPREMRSTSALHDTDEDDDDGHRNAQPNSHRRTPSDSKARRGGGALERSQLLGGSATPQTTVALATVAAAGGSVRDDSADGNALSSTGNGSGAVATVVGASGGGSGGAAPVSLLHVLSLAGVWQVVVRRTAILVSLLLLQSLSQFILEFYEHLISYHIVVPLFLTMLVGAGGNAGNQATVRVIAGLVTGQLTVADTWNVLKSEVVIGLINGIILAGIGFTRVYWLYEEGSGLFWSALAITVSLFTIVFVSAVLGTLLPFLLEYVGVDREHAAPAIQVIMDICGVLITCVVCTLIIPESEHAKFAPIPITTTALPVVPPG